MIFKLLQTVCNLNGRLLEPLFEYLTAVWTAGHKSGKTLVCYSNGSAIPMSVIQIPNVLHKINEISFEALIAHIQKCILKFLVPENSWLRKECCHSLCRSSIDLDAPLLFRLNSWDVASQQQCTKETKKRDNNIDERGVLPFSDGR